MVNTNIISAANAMNDMLNFFFKKKYFAAKLAFYF